jgi:RimJ/RimL family protein N-acetyltransferase
VNDPLLETERMIGRKWRLEDAEAAFELYSDPEVMRYLNLAGMPLVPDVETQRANLGKTVERFQDVPYGVWAMRLKDGGDLAAVILLKALPGSENIEVGWHVARRQWGNGYATEGGRELIRYGFEDLGLEEIFAVVYAENTPSIRVTQRLGMEHLGPTSEYYGRELELFRIVKP